MAYEILNVDDFLITVRISGVMQPSDQRALQAKASELLRQGRALRLLAVLENFQGWQRSDEWGDVTFLMEHADQFAKMAIVGDERWRDDALLFVGQGLRTTEIEFFAPTSLEEAEAWVRA